MSVKVRLSFPMRKFTNGQETVEVAGRTPLECIRNLGFRYPGIKTWLYGDSGDLRPNFQFFVNGELIHAGEFTKPLADGDELYILLIVGGG